LTWVGSVPDLPEIHVEAPTPHECRERLTRAISQLLAGDGENIPIRDRSEAGVLSVGTATVGVSQTATGERRAQHHSDPLDLEFAEIIYEKRDWVAYVTINRPEVYNAYSDTTLVEMTRAFRDAASDERVAVLVLTGAGDRAFCSGSDVKQHSEEHVGRSLEFWKWMGLLIEAHNALRQLGKPSIARINGIVAGGGNEWNLACDLAIAANHAKFMHVETSVGMVAACGATQWLPLVVGDRRAREMLLTGEPISAEKALAWGLVNEVVQPAELDNAVDGLCRKLIGRFPDCTRYTRKQLSYWRDSVWEATIEQAREWLALHFAGPEAAEGMSGLAERRAMTYRSLGAPAFTSSESPSAPENGSHSVGASATSVCARCGANGLPVSFNFCGICGNKIT
jgi:enoyl-CoA hydratase/carnithine racemase/predicted RNase H-like HicB family nuclease